jgi:DNA-binding NtrC family response regulator
LPTVLLIDDSPVQVRAREAVLRTAGFESHIATSAESALALLRTLSIAARLDAVITDHLLSEGTGVDVVRELRTLHPHLPVIVITGSAEAESEYDALNVIFRHKPCPPEDLIALVRSVVQKASGAA